MSMRVLIPWRRQENPSPAFFRDEERSPYVQLRREMDRLFEDFFRAPLVGGIALLAAMTVAVCATFLSGGVPLRANDRSELLGLLGSAAILVGVGVLDDLGVVVLQAEIEGSSFFAPFLIGGIQRGVRCDWLHRGLDGINQTSRDRHDHANRVACFEADGVIAASQLPIHGEGGFQPIGLDDAF